MEEILSSFLVRNGVAIHSLARCWIEFHALETWGAALHQLGVIPLASVLGGVLTQTIGIRWLIAISAAGLFGMFVAMARFSEIRKV